MIVFSIIPMIPLLFYLADGYYERNVTKGFLHIGLFTILVTTSISLLYLIGWTFALYTPLLLFTMIVLKPKNRSKAINDHSTE